MRLPAIMAGVLFAATFYVVQGTQPAHAESQNQQNQVAQAAPAQPAAGPKQVEVKPGDYLAKIAKENQTTYPRLFDANLNIKDPDVIHPGEKLRIPSADEQLASRSAPVQAPAPTPAPVKRRAPAQQTVQPRAIRATPPAAAVSSGSVWDRLAQCESGGNWSINTGNGYYGGLQFSLSSWRGVGGAGYPHQASREEQIYRATLLQARQGWGAWPACTAKLGIR